jgi:hypothetical protein
VPRNTVIYTLAIALKNLAIIFFVVSLPIGVLLGIGSAVCFILMANAKVNVKRNVEDIGNKYNEMNTQGNKQIEDCVEQWKSAREIAYQFSTKPLPELIA